MIRDTVALAVGGVLANKVRSLLTVLSIGIGVFAVITLMAVAAGAAQGAQGQLEGLGSPRLITVSPGGDGAGVYVGPDPAALPPDLDAGELDAFDAFDPMATTYAPPPPLPLSVGDVALLSGGDTTPDVAAAAGFHQSYGQVSTTTGGFSDLEITGTSAAFLDVGAVNLMDGVFLSEADVTTRARVVVLNETATQNLGVSLGSEVLLQGSPLLVVGTARDQYPGSPSGWLPETTTEDLLLGPQPGYAQVAVLAGDEAGVETAADQVRDTLRRAHYIGPTDPADFTVYTRTEELRSIRAITLLFQVLAAAIASVALFVAGIGVMNIMLVTVTERTREIGIRTAVGARRSHLIGQFLLEAVILTGLGGLAGTLLGSLTQLIEVGGFSPVVTPFSVGLALSFSVVTGLFFGLYPANRAASMPPVQALRHE